jgi:hypothetical protein
MALPFEPSTTASQNSTGLVTTFLDTSNYTDNDEGYVKADFTTNTIQIYDAYGVLLQTSNFLTSDEVTFEQTADTWFTIVRTLAGIASYEVTEKFALNRITTNKLQDVLSSGCCQGRSNEANLCKVNTFLQDADYAIPIGNAVRWQLDINNANSYLDQILL